MTPKAGGVGSTGAPGAGAPVSSQVICRSRGLTPCDLQPSTYVHMAKLFCVICRNAKQQGLLRFSKHQSMAFIDQGFGSLNKAVEMLNDHEMHKEVVANLAAKSSSANIALQLHTQSKAEQEFRRKMLLSSLHFLARQGLPFREKSPLEHEPKVVCSHVYDVMRFAYTHYAVFRSLAIGLLQHTLHPSLFRDW